MSTWRNVGITYLKYADICATHVRNALKEPAKTKAKSSSNMHARITQWEAGKRGEPRELRLPPLRVACAEPPRRLLEDPPAPHRVAIATLNCRAQGGPRRRGCVRSGQRARAGPLPPQPPRDATTCHTNVKEALEMSV